MAFPIAWILDKMGQKMYAWSSTKAVMDFDRGGEKGQLLQETLKKLEDGMIYKIGDTITTTSAEFNPNMMIGGTWVQNIDRTLYIKQTSIEFTNGASAANGAYKVVNGICIVQLNRVNVTVPEEPFAVNLPPTSFGCYFTVSSGQTIYVGDINANNASLRCTGTTTAQFAQLIYPIADTAMKTYYVWAKTA